jgi:hypothetical protein
MYCFPNETLLDLIDQNMFTIPLLPPALKENIATSNVHLQVLKKYGYFLELSDIQDSLIPN